MSIIFEDICFSYFEDRRNILDHWSAEFSADRITVLTGLSGCGKSTLLYLAAGLYPHITGVLRSGRVLVDGQDPQDLEPPRRSRLLGMMFQDPDLQFCMDTVKNELIFCLENQGADPASMEQQVDEALAFCEIPHLKDRSLQTLSGGEKQRVALACLAVLQPRWLLLDEPFANIDDASAGTIAAKLLQLHRERGVGILAVDHRLDTWMGVADDLAVFLPGETAPQIHPLAQLDASGLEAMGIIAPGGSYAAQLPPPPGGEVVLQLQDLRLRHQETEVLSGVDAQFRRGHIYAVMGQSGCGKSSLFGALSGMFKYTGHALLEGAEVRKLRGKKLGAMGFVTQDPQDQFVGGTVADEIAISLRGHDHPEEETEDILRGIRLWRFRDISPYMLSQGQQRRLGVAALMAYDCKVLVCDEPTYAQDRKNAMAIMDTLCRQARDHHVALIFSTHDRQLAMDYADEILEMKGGRLHAFSGSHC